MGWESTGGGGGATQIDGLTDVDTTTSPPAIGEVLKWNGSNWVPDTDNAGSVSDPSDPVVEPVPGVKQVVIDSAFGIVNTNRFITYESGTVGPVEYGTEPANGVYGALWTRDHAYTLWHMPWAFTATQRRGFVTNRLDRRSTVPADFVADRIEQDGTAVYKNAGTSDLPFMDGIAFVVLALWADWKTTGDTSTFDTYQTVIDDCLAALPTSASGCVWSDPAAPSVDYGFTDTVKKTGDVAYGTALLALANKMLAEIAGEAGTGTYSTARAAAEAGSATLRQVDGWYQGSSVNNAAVDDVWATALIVAEGLCDDDERVESAATLLDAYRSGTITQNGWVRHLPTGQNWVNTTVPAGTYQNGGYWATPLWDCIRAVALIDSMAAFEWAAEAIRTYRSQIDDEGTVGTDTAPYEWFNGATLSTAKGYTASAALFTRFAPNHVDTIYIVTPTATTIDDPLTSDTSANYTFDAGVAYSADNDAIKATDPGDGAKFIHNTALTADQAVEIDVKVELTSGINIFPSVILRYQDANNYLYALPSLDTPVLRLYERVAGTNNLLASVSMAGASAASQFVTIRAWVIGDTFEAEILGQHVSATVSSILTGGEIGGVHGDAGDSGDTYWTNIRAWQITADTAPTDAAMAHADGLVEPGGNLRPFRSWVLVDAAGRPLVRGDADSAPVGITP